MFAADCSYNDAEREQLVLLHKISGSKQRHPDMRDKSFENRAQKQANFQDLKVTNLIQLCM